MKSNAKIGHAVKHTTKQVRKANAKSNTRKNASVESAAAENPTAKIVQSWVRATSEAITAFDFERAAEYYEKLDWKWGLLSGDSGGIPTEDDIRHMVTTLIDECIEGVMEDPESRSDFHCSTGGLFVVAHKFPNPDDNWIWIGMTVVETMY